MNGTIHQNNIKLIQIQNSKVLLLHLSIYFVEICTIELIYKPKEPMCTDALFQHSYWISVLCQCHFDNESKQTIKASHICSRDQYIFHHIFVCTTAHQFLLLSHLMQQEIHFICLPGINYCPIHVVTFTLISYLVAGNPNALCILDLI